MHPLISVDQLAATKTHLHLCDLRWDLIDPEGGRARYESGHIPGAVFVDLDRDLAAPPGSAGRHPLPDPEEFASSLGRLGIDPDTHVVAYDDSQGRIDARLWWMLRSVGHDAVQILDGGYQAWIAAGHDVGVGTVTPEAATYPVPVAFHGVVTHDQLDGRAVIDAREGERYRGEIEPVDPKAGHIPGAVNVPSSANVGEDGRFLDAEELKLIYSAIGDRAVMSCGSGVTACHNALAMVLAGHDMPDVYVGSFSEWSRHDLPVTKGPNP